MPRCARIQRASLQFARTHSCRGLRSSGRTVTALPQGRNKITTSARNRTRNTSAGVIPSCRPAIATAFALDAVRPPAPAPKAPFRVPLRELPGGAPPRELFGWSRMESPVESPGPETWSRCSAQPGRVEQTEARVASGEGSDPVPDICCTERTLLR